MSVIESIRYGLSNLLRFTGRDRRGLFWPYALCAYFLVTGVSIIAALPDFYAFTRGMTEFAQAHPDQTEVSVGPGSYSMTVHGYHPDLSKFFGDFMLLVIVSGIVTVLLLAAAVTRRLHDRGRSGLWGLAPVALAVTGFVVFARLFASFDEKPLNLTLFVLGFLNNSIYLILVAVLIIQLVLPSKPDANRFGSPETA